MANILETIMLLCFGFSWPINFMKSWKVRSAKGVSLTFLCLIEIGYIAGISAKLINGSINYVLFFYVLNLVVVAANIVLYFINRRRDRLREGGLR